MIKNLLIAGLIILLTACGINIDKVENSNINENFTYPLEKLGLREDDSLYKNTQGLDFPDDIKSKDYNPYSKKELKNLDYANLIEISGLNIRIPSRCKVFSDGNTYYIDFPYSKSYNIYISIKEVKDADILEEKNINKACNILLDKINPDEKLISGVVNNNLYNIDSAYFISKKGKYDLTHFLIDAPTSKIHFTIYEDTSLSQASAYIMQDLLIGAFSIDDDPLDIQKSFKSFDEYISIFATKDIKIGDVMCKIPQNFLLEYSNENLNNFALKKEGEIVSEIITISFDKKDNNLMDIFNLDYSELVYPANIVTGSKIAFKERGGISYLRSKARMYMPDFTLEGDKFVVETKDSFITFFILGPLSEANQTSLMTSSIIESIQ